MPRAADLQRNGVFLRPQGVRVASVVGERVTRWAKGGTVRAGAQAVKRARSRTREGNRLAIPGHGRAVTLNSLVNSGRCDPHTNAASPLPPNLTDGLWRISGLALDPKHSVAAVFAQDRCAAMD